MRKEHTPAKLDQQTDTERMNIQIASVVWSLLAIASYRVTLVRSQGPRVPEESMEVKAHRTMWRVLEDESGKYQLNIMRNPSTNDV